MATEQAVRPYALDRDGEVIRPGTRVVVMESHHDDCIGHYGDVDRFEPGCMDHTGHLADDTYCVVVLVDGTWRILCRPTDLAVSLFQPDTLVDGSFQRTDNG